METPTDTTASDAPPSDTSFAPADFSLREAMRFNEIASFWKAAITEVDLSNTLVLGTQSSWTKAKPGGREKPLYEGLERVVCGLSQKPVVKLKLANVGLSCAGMNIVCRLLGACNKTLTELDLSRNNIWHKGFRVLAAAVTHDAVLEKLDCSGNAARDIGAARFAQMLKSNNTLRHLSLADNFIFDEGGIALAKALLKNCALQSLDLARNRISLVSTYAFDKVLLKNTSLETLRLQEDGQLAPGNIGVDPEEVGVREKILETNQRSNSLRKMLQKIRKKEKEIAQKFSLEKTAMNDPRKSLSDEELELLKRMDTALTNRYEQRKQQVIELQKDIEDLEKSAQDANKRMIASQESKEHVDKLRGDIEKKTSELDGTNLEHLRVIERLRARKAKALEKSLDLDEKASAAEADASLAKGRYDDAEKVWISLRRKTVDLQIDIDAMYAEIHKLDKANETRQASLLELQQQQEDLKAKVQLSREKRDKAQTKLNELARRQSDAGESLQEALEIQASLEEEMRKTRREGLYAEGELDQNKHDVDENVATFLEKRLRKSLDEIKHLTEEKDKLQEHATNLERDLQNARDKIEELRAEKSALEIDLQNDSASDEVDIEEKDRDPSLKPQNLPEIQELSSLPCQVPVRPVRLLQTRPKTIIQNSSTATPEQKQSQLLHSHNHKGSDSHGAKGMMSPVSDATDSTQAYFEAESSFDSLLAPIPPELSDSNADSKEVDANAKAENPSQLAKQAIAEADKDSVLAEVNPDGAEEVTDDQTALGRNVDSKESPGVAHASAASPEYSPIELALEQENIKTRNSTIPVSSETIDRSTNQRTTIRTEKLNRPLPVPKGKLSSLASSVLSQEPLQESGPAPVRHSPPPVPVRQAESAPVRRSPPPVPVRQKPSELTTDSFITESSESDPEEELKRIDEHTVVELHEESEEPHESSLYPHERMKVHTKHVHFNLHKHALNEAEDSVIASHSGHTNNSLTIEPAENLSQKVDEQGAAPVIEESSNIESPTQVAAFPLEALHSLSEGSHEGEDDGSGSEVDDVRDSSSSSESETKSEDLDLQAQNLSDTQASAEERYRNRLEIGQVFAMKRQSTMRWKYPRYVWVSSDLKQLLWNSGERKTTRYESLPAWTFDGVVTQKAKKSRWQPLNKIIHKDASRTVTLANAGGKKENIQLRCSGAVEAEMWSETFAWWIEMNKKQRESETRILHAVGQTPDKVDVKDIERIRQATVEVVHDDIDDPNSTYKTMRLRVCERLGMQLEGDEWYAIQIKMICHALTL